MEKDVVSLLAIPITPVGDQPDLWTDSILFVAFIALVVALVRLWLMWQGGAPEGDDQQIGMLLEEAPTIEAKAIGLGWLLLDAGWILRAVLTSGTEGPAGLLFRLVVALVAGWHFSKLVRKPRKGVQLDQCRLVDPPFGYALPWPKGARMVACGPQGGMRRRSKGIPATLRFEWVSTDPDGGDGDAHA